MTLCWWAEPWTSTSTVSQWNLPVRSTHTHRFLCIYTFLTLCPVLHKHSLAYISTCSVYTSRPTALKAADASSVVFVEHTKTCYSSFVRPPPPPRPPPSDTYTQTTHQVVSSPVILGQVCLPWVQGVKLTQSSDVIENVWLCVFDLNKKKKKNIHIYLFFLSQWLVWSWTSAPGWPDSSTPPRGWMWVYPVPMSLSLKRTETHFLTLCSVVSPVQWWDLWMSEKRWGNRFKGCFFFVNLRQYCWNPYICFNKCFCFVWSQYVDCVILDDGGFLVMSNRDEYLDQVGLCIVLI